MSYNRHIRLADALIGFVALASFVVCVLIVTSLLSGSH